MGDKDSFILFSQFHGCWLPGDARNQGIFKYGIVQVIIVVSQDKIDLQTIWSVVKVNYLKDTILLI